MRNVNIGSRYSPVAPVSLLNARLSGRGVFTNRLDARVGLQIVRRWTRSDESAKFLGGLINDAFQLFGAPGMPEATEN